jgi:Fe-S-cluster-containing hydrogenase component 2
VRRFERSTGHMLIPESDFGCEGQIAVFKNSQISLLAGSIVESGCLRCPDTPCVTLSIQDISKKTRVESVANLEQRVCPTDALRVNDEGAITVDDMCMSCGLCVARCPVHAIHLDTSIKKAFVSQSTVGYKSFAGTDEEFFEVRDRLSRSFETTKSDQVPVEFLVSVMEKVSSLTQLPNGMRAIQLLVRNAFLLNGIAARLKNPGDNNNWTELALDDGANLFPVEIEIASDGLDSARRVMSDVAIVCSRYGVLMEEVIPIVIMFQLPNIRTDYYGVVTNIYERVGLRIFTVPLALVIWSIIDRNIDLIKSIMSFCYVDERNVRTSRLTELMGTQRDNDLAIALGFIPPK